MEETESLTFAELEKICKQFADKKAEIEVLETQVKSLKAEQEDLQQIISTHLDSLEKSSYDSAVGKVVAKDIFTVSSPKTPEAREKFFAYLKEKGVFDDLISINSKTLNAFYKAEKKIADENQQLEFNIPGLDEPYYKRTISLTRKK